METEGRGQEPRGADHSAREEKRESVRLLTVVQIVGCCIVLGAAVLLRAFGGSVYDTVRDWYLDAAGDSIVTDDTISNVKRAVVDLWPSVSSAPGTASAPPVFSAAEQGAAQASSAVSQTASSAESTGSVSRTDSK